MSGQDTVLKIDQSKCFICQAGLKFKYLA